MNLILTDEGNIRLAGLLIGHDTTPLDLVGNLFVSDTSPSLTTVLGDMSFCILPGYIQSHLADITSDVTVNAGVGMGTAVPFLFDILPYAGPTVTLFGFCVYDNSESISLWAARFDAPLPIPLAGASIALEWSDTTKVA